MDANERMGAWRRAIAQAETFLYQDNPTGALAHGERVLAETKAVLSAGDDPAVAAFATEVQQHVERYQKQATLWRERVAARRDANVQHERNVYQRPLPNGR